MPLHLYLNGFSYIAVPVFVGLACRAWLKGGLGIVPNWRRRVGLASILVVSADWFTVILLFRWLRYFSDAVINCLTLSALIAALLALALSGRARICAVAASVSMCVFYLTAWVE